MKTIVIIGGGMAGARACVNLRAQGYAGGIVLLAEENHPPYDRPPLSKSSITQTAEPAPVRLMDEAIARELEVDLRQGVAAIALDPAAKTVRLADGSAVAYDKLLIATGARPRKLAVPGGDHALTLRSHEDSLELRRRFQPGKSIVIIGGGFIGLELASSAVGKGCRVTVVEARPRILMRGVPEALARIVHERHVQAGVTMLTGVGLSHLGENGVHLADGRVLGADSIIAGVGAVPETKLAAEAGLEIDNGIACDRHMRTSDPDIHAAGDCASFIHAKLGSRIRLEAWRSAQDQAATAAETMLGGTAEHAAIPWFWSDQYELGLQMTGFAELGPVTVARKSEQGVLVLFHLAADGTIMGASGIGPGTAVARDIKLSEMMIARALKPPVDMLADPKQPLKPLVKG
jgi:3-phenylpropionate/trans-cinnamate dioxygenase ferredoxin reductase subunit